MGQSHYTVRMYICRSTLLYCTLCIICISQFINLCTFKQIFRGGHTLSICWAIVLKKKKISNRFPINLSHMLWQISVNHENITKWWTFFFNPDCCSSSLVVSLYADPDPGGLPCNADQCIRNTVFTDHISENYLQHDKGEEAGGLVKLAATRNECI